jgi:hypothetical protein
MGFLGQGHQICLLATKEHVFMTTFKLKLHIHTSVQQKIILIIYEKMSQVVMCIKRLLPRLPKFKLVILHSNFLTICP